MNIDLFEGFPVDKEWPQVELHVATPDQPGTVSVPMIAIRKREARPSSCSHPLATWRGRYRRPSCATP
jgi:hypothetical protein